MALAARSGPRMAESHVRLCPSAAAWKLNVFSRWPMLNACVEEPCRTMVTFLIAAAFGVVDRERLPVVHTGGREIVRRPRALEEVGRREDLVGELLGHSAAVPTTGGEHPAIGEQGGARVIHPDHTGVGERPPGPVLPPRDPTFRPRTPRRSRWRIHTRCSRRS